MRGDRTFGMLQRQSTNATNPPNNAKLFSFSGTLNSLGKIDSLSEFRFRWNSNEEVFTILTSLEEHKDWAANEVKIRPPNGSQLLYNRNNLKTRHYHNDKYFWKTRKNSKSSARIDHSSLRIRGIECIYCSYVHSALVPTFHRRCYWLLENPDIVLVHYLNIPDKTTTFDDLVTSLLPFKKLTEQELLCQLQPILTSSGDEGNNNTVDVNKLITDVKNYKEPKRKGRNNQKKTSGTNKQAGSSTLRKPSETIAKGSHILDKCSNCNRYYTTKCSETSSSSRTNVAVTINRQAGTTARSRIVASDESCFGHVNVSTEHSRSNGTGQGLVSMHSAVQNAAEPNFLSADTIPHDTCNQGILSADLTAQDHSAQLYHCHDLFHEQPYSAALDNSINTSSTSYQGYGSLPVTTQADPSVLNSNDLVVLDYDGINLVQSTCSQSENDFSKAFDISLFENDLLDYLPDYLPEVSVLQTNQQVASPGIMTGSFPPMTSKETGVTEVTSHSNFSEVPLGNNVMSSQIGDLSHPQYSNGLQQSSTVHTILGTRVGQPACCATDMIFTDCHTFRNLTPSVQQTGEARTVNNLVQGSHQCPSKDQALTSDSGRNMFQMGVPDISVPEMGISQVDLFQDGLVQMGVSQLGVPLVGTSNAISGQEKENMTTHAVGSQTNLPDVRMSHGSKEVKTATEGGPSNVRVSEMDVYSNVTCVPTLRGSTQSNSDQQVMDNPSGDIITEFSPEWSYCDGKTKVLILGDWSRTIGPYSCLFDGCSASAALIQPGVLRCFCPPHDPGLVALQVAWNGFIISNACVFEYKTRQNATNSASDWLGTSDEDLQKLILERIARLESILGIGVSPASTESGTGTPETEVETVDDRIVRICEVLLGRVRSSILPDTGTRYKGLTLLHLAAGLGYTKLIFLLQEHARSEMSRSTRTENGSEDDTADISEQCAEWSPHTVDSYGCTPLMWACWRGHEDAALALLAWQPSSYSDCDHSGRSAKAIAQEMGHVGLVNKMEEFMRGEDMYSLVMESSPQSPSSSCAYLSVSSNERTPQSPISADSLTWERVDGVSEPLADFEMASVISEERSIGPNTLGKVLVEIRTLIQQAEERARSPLQTPSNSAPFALGFAGFPDLPCDESSTDNLLTADPDLMPGTPHYDTLSIDSSPIRTPSSHSPGSPGIRNSPQSTETDTSEFEEFLSKPRQFLERDFSELTLTDIEQQELLQAAKVIQNAYRQFKIRKKQHIDELKAAVLIQSYYRRYKQFALYKRITKAAVLIQNSYRAHKEHKQFKRSRHAAAVIQNYFRHYRKRKQRHAEEDAPGKRLETKYRKPS